MKVFTARVNYKGKHAVQITAATKHFLAPSWNLVMSYKEGKIKEDQYEDQYVRMLDAQRKQNPEEWEQFVKNKKVVLLCFCPAGSFCHRVLAAKYLERHFKKVKYFGEIQ